MRQLTSAFLEQIGYIAFHTLVFIIFFVLISRAKKVSMFFKVFMTALLIILFVGPMYLQVHTMITLFSEQRSSELEHVSKTPLPFSIEDIDSLLANSLTSDWANYVEYDELLFLTKNGIQGKLRKMDDTLVEMTLEYDFDLSDDQKKLALVELQLYLGVADETIVQSRWIPKQITEAELLLAAGDTEGFQRKAKAENVELVLEFTPESKTLIVTVFGKQ